MRTRAELLKKSHFFGRGEGVTDGRALNAYPPARIHALPYDTTTQHERMLAVGRIGASTKPIRGLGESLSTDSIRQIVLNRRLRSSQ